MLRYLYGKDLANFPVLRDSMFRDRAEQFAARLGWDVTVDAQGHECDAYDGLNPLYAIWQDESGRHGGSMRFLPTLGPTLVNDHFAHLTQGVRIESPLIWECTRFCLAPGASRQVTAALVLAAGEIMESFSLSHFVGVFDRRMVPIYRSFGLEPDVIGSAGEGGDAIAVGLWEMRAEAWPGVLRRAGVSREISRQWLRASLATDWAGASRTAVA